MHCSYCARHWKPTLAGSTNKHHTPTMKFELFIARRIFSDSGEGKRFSRPAIIIAMSGIAIGIAVMIISLSVVLGFKNEVSHKVHGFGSHIQVVSLSQTHDYEMLPVLTGDSLLRRVKKQKGLDHIQQFALKIGMLKTEEDFCGITFKGIGEEYDTTFLAQHIKEGSMPSFGSKESSGKIMISAQTANALHLKAGDKVFAYFVGKTSMRARRFTISCIFDTNMDDYDRMYAFTDIHTIRKLNNWKDDESSGYEITVNDYSQLATITAALNKRVAHNFDRNGVTYGVYSIEELAPHTFSWLKVLDMNVIMIIILMFCVATFTVVSGLLIIMLERINMIGILKSMGATNFSVRKIFVHFAIMLVGRGLIIGSVAGIALCYLQKYLHIAKLDASVYYIDNVPIEICWQQYLLVNAGTILLSAIVILGSSYLISINKPVKSLRFE